MTLLDMRLAEEKLQEEKTMDNIKPMRVLVAREESQEEIS